MNFKEKNEFRKQCAGMALEEMKHYQLLIYQEWIKNAKDTQQIQSLIEKDRILDQFIALEKLIS